MSTIQFHLRNNIRNTKAPVSKEKDTGEVNVVFPLLYRLLFYVGGIVFAFVSYIAAVWSFSLESQTWGLAMFTGSVADHINAHVLSFFVWTVICIGVSVITGSLFHREFRYRVMAEKLANIDGLTGLYNHAYFQKRLDEEIDRAARHKRCLSLIMLDLDNFKLFNDTWGHQEGDLLLKWFSEILNKSVRNHDIVARYGGEEFVVILPETDAPSAMVVAERIVDAARRHSSATMGKGRHVTVSAGISTFPTHGPNKHNLITGADTALYQAKTEGKNQAIAFSADGTRIIATSSADSYNQSDTSDSLRTIRYLAEIVNCRSGYAQNHSSNVEGYTQLLGQAIGLSAEELGNLRIAAILHDLGSICIPESILMKTEPLTDDDWDIIHEHVKVGTALLLKVGQSESIIPGIKYHHERYDGTGYPNALSGQDIPLPARIIAIADAYESMTSPRPYRKTMSSRRALNELRRCAGSQFDPELTTAFINSLATNRRRKAA